jgi:hypothetical protein
LLITKQIVTAFLLQQKLNLIQQLHKKKQNFNLLAKKTFSFFLLKKNKTNSTNKISINKNKRLMQQKKN